MPTATTERRKMTPEEATYFNRYSVGNASMALHQLNESGACKGSCQVDKKNGASVATTSAN